MKTILFYGLVNFYYLVCTKYYNQNLIRLVSVHHHINKLTQLFCPNLANVVVFVSFFFVVKKVKVMFALSVFFGFLLLR